MKNEKKNKVQASQLHGVVRAVRAGVKRYAQPVLSGFLALTMIIGSVPAPAYAEMMDEAARSLALMVQERERTVEAERAAEPAAEQAVEAESADAPAPAQATDQQDSAPQEVPAPEPAAQQAPDAQAAAPVESAPSAEEVPAPAEPAAPTGETPDAIFISNDGLKAVTVSGDALASRAAAVRSLKDAGASEQDAKDAAAAVFDAPSSGAPSDKEEIQSVAATWLTKGDGVFEGNPNTILFRPSDDGFVSMRLRVAYTLAGKSSHAPGTITITIPEYIFTGRDGNPVGRLKLSVPAEPATQAGWNYRRITRDGQKLISITNTRRVEATAQGFMEFAIVDVLPSSQVDLKPSAPFNATYEMVLADNKVETKTSNDIAAVFDTYATLEGISKSCSSTPYFVSARDGAVAVAHKAFPEAKGFIVVPWYTNAHIKGNQPSRVSMKDELADSFDSIMLREDATDGGRTFEKQFAEGDNLGTTTHERVLVAYPVEQFEHGKSYTFKNKVAYTSQEVDPEPDGTKKPVQKEDMVAEYAWFYRAPQFIEPGGHYNLYNYGNDNTAYDGESFLTHHPSSGYSASDLSSSGVTGFDGYYGLYGKGVNALAGGTDLHISYTFNPVGYMLPWTYQEPEGPVSGNPMGVLDNYGKKPVIMAVEQQGLRTSSRKLTAGKDFEYESVSFPQRPVIKKAMAINLNEDGTVDFGTHDDGTVDYSIDSDPQNIPEIALQVKTAGSDVWQTHATMNWKTGTLVVAYASGEVSSESIVRLPEGTIAWRTVSQSTVAALMYFGRANVVLKASGAMGEIASSALSASGAPSVVVESDAVLRVEGKDGESIYSSKKRGPNRLMGYTDEVRAQMTNGIGRYSESDYDVANARIKVRLSSEVTKKSLIADRSVYEEAMAAGDLLPERSGTWYDLLPLGMTPITSSVSLRDGDKIQFIDTIENFRGTGRTLLIVKAALSPKTSSYVSGGVHYYQDVLRIGFEAWYGLDDIALYGNEFHNVAIYQSANDEVGNVKGYRGEPDDPRSDNNFDTSSAFYREDSKILDALTNIDGVVPEKNNTLYAGDGGSVDPLQHGDTGLSKEVSVNNEDSWGMGAHVDKERLVYSGGAYTYRLSVTTANSMMLRDVVLYDSLENHVPAAADQPSQGDVPRWRGTFNSIDISQLEQLGCEPVVYYSTAESKPGKGLELSYDRDGEVVEIAENTDLKNAKVWKRTTPAALNALPHAERAQITALAVDASKKRDGSEFIMKGAESAAVLIRMEAPRGEEAKEIIKNKAQAFNSVHMASTFKAPFDPSWRGRSFARQGYTAVGMQPYSVTVRKEWRDDNDRDALRPDSVTVQLMANGQDVKGQQVVLSAQNNWGPASFDDLPYLDENGNKLLYSVREEPASKDYVPEIVRDGNNFVLRNHHDALKTTVRGTKVWHGDNASTRPSQISVDLFANGVKIAERIVRPNVLGRWDYVFDDLYVNEDGVPITYEIRENLGDNIEYIPQVDGFDIHNTYHPFGDLVVSKTTTGDVNEVSRGKDFTFRFSFEKDGIPFFDDIAYEVVGEGVDPNAPVTGVVSTDGVVTLRSGQSVRLKELPSGLHYAVDEVNLPGGYKPQGESHREGEILANRTQEQRYVNEYRAMCEVGLGASKRLNGTALTPFRFSFLLQDETGAVVRRARNGRGGAPQFDTEGNVVSEGDVLFGSLEFDQHDSGKTFTYLMSEETTDGSGVTCGTATYKVVVSPQDNGDGTMTARVVYEPADAAGSLQDGKPLFENVYRSAGEVSLQAHKTLRGGELADGQFAFDLDEVIVEKDGATRLEHVQQGVANKANGSIQFAPIAFDQRDAGSKHLYAIHEVAGGNSSMTYDQHYALVEVSVADDAMGTMGFDMKMDNVSCSCFVCGGDGKLADGSACAACTDGVINSTIDGLTFVNEWHPAGLDIQKTLKEGATASDPNHEFEFELTLTNEAGEPVSGYDFSGATLEPVDGGTNTPETQRPSADEQASDADQPAAGQIDDAQQGPLAAVAAWARDAVSALFAPETAYAAEPRAIQEGTENNGGWSWKFDPVSGELVASGFVSGGTMEVKLRNVVQRLQAKSVRFEPGSKAWGVRLFELCETVEYVDLTNLTIADRDMSSMFMYCANLKRVVFGGLDTSRISKMHNMFYQSGISELPDFDTLDTRNVKTIHGMFEQCSNLKDVSLAGMDFRNAETFYNVFGYCSSLQTVDFTGTNLAKAGSFAGAFTKCAQLQYVDFSTTTILSPTSMDEMFNECGNLQWVDLSHIDTSGVRGTKKMFNNCASLRRVVTTEMDFSSISDMDWMFTGCSLLSYIDMANFKGGRPEKVERLFEGCKKLAKIDMSQFDFSRPTGLDTVFGDCEEATEIVLPDLRNASVTSTRGMFRNCKKLSSIDLSSFSMANVTMCGEMFAGCETLTSIDLSNCELTKVENMGRMFKDCINLTSVNLDGINTSNVTSFWSMFENCKALAGVDVTYFNTAAVTDMRSMFKGCDNLKRLDLSSFDTLACEKTGEMFTGCAVLSEVVLGENFRFADALLPNEYSWIRIDDQGVPVVGARPYTAEELNREYPHCGVGTYAWNTYGTLAFDTNGGIGSASQTSVNWSGDVVVPSPVVVRFGYRFTGWKSGDTSFEVSPDGMIEIPQEQAKNLFKNAPEGLVTLVAQWEKSDAVTEVSKGVYRFKVPAGHVLHLPSVIPSGTGYTVRELDEAGYKFVESSGTAGIVTADAPEVSRAAFVNAELAPGEAQPARAEIRVAKMLDGHVASAADGFQFKMTGYDPATGSADGSWSAVVADGGAVAFPALSFDEGDLGVDQERTFEYRIVEVKGDDAAIVYDGSTVIATVTLTKGDGGSLSTKVAYAKDDKPVARPAFENATKPAALSIEKIVEGAAAPDEPFTFRMTLDGLPYEGAYAVDDKQLQAKDGIIKVAGGKIARIDGLSAGVAYTVDEIDLPAGWSLDSAVGATGTLVAGETSKARFTNGYAVSAPATAQLMAWKSFPGGGLGDGAFSFDLYDGPVVDPAKLVSSAVNGPVDAADKIPGPDGAPVANPHKGMAPVYFTEQSFWAAGVYEFTMVERVPSDAPGVAFDRAPRRATVTVVDNGDGTLSSSIVYTDAEGSPLDDAPVFVNRPNPVAFSLSKVVTTDLPAGSPARDAVFTFDVDLKDAQGDPLFKQAYRVLGVDGSWGEPLEVSDGGSIQLRAGERALFEHLPYGAFYSVSEQPLPGWNIDAQACEGEVAGTLTSLDAPTAVVVANAYAAEGSIAISGMKRYDGVLHDDQFTFDLVEVRPGGVREVVATAKNKADGSIDFGAMRYTLQDVGARFTYEVMERNQGESGIAYDKAVYSIEVTPRDNGDGTIACDYTIMCNGERVDAIVFTNSRAVELPFTGGSGVGAMGVLVIAMGCMAYLVDRKRKTRSI